MEATYNDWVYGFMDFNEKIQGDFKLVKLEAPRIRRDCFESRISYNYKGFSVTCRQICSRTTYVNGYEDLIFESLVKHKEPFSLYISALGFLEKLFHRDRFYTEIAALDKKYLIETSDEKIAYLIFKDPALVNFLSGSYFSMLNIHNESDTTVVTLKRLVSKIYSIEEMTGYYEIFKNLLDVLDTLPDRRVE